MKIEEAVLEALQETQVVTSDVNWGVGGSDAGVSCHKEWEIHHAI